jgi:hypothetical protein
VVGATGKAKANSNARKLIITIECMNTQTALLLSVVEHLNHQSMALKGFTPLVLITVACNIKDSVLCGKATKLCLCGSLTLADVVDLNTLDQVSKFIELLKREQQFEQVVPRIVKY